jgi:hypothetical protein
MNTTATQKEDAGSGAIEMDLALLALITSILRLTANGVTLQWKIPAPKGKIVDGITHVSAPVRPTGENNDLFIVDCW